PTDATSCLSVAVTSLAPIVLFQSVASLVTVQSLSVRLEALHPRGTFTSIFVSAGTLPAAASTEMLNWRLALFGQPPGVIAKLSAFQYALGFQGKVTGP